VSDTRVPPGRAVSLDPPLPLTLECRVEKFLARGAKWLTHTNYRYTREHEWIELNGAVGTVGITDYAQNSLGDIVYVDVPKVGDAVTANATFGSVESVKAVSDLYSPVTGTVTEVNEALKTEPDKINAAPHETWIIKVELSDPSQFDALLDAAAYEAFVSEETAS
jgi:glycine cleavage system H protein